MLPVALQITVVAFSPRVDKLARSLPVAADHNGAWWRALTVETSAGGRAPTSRLVMADAAAQVLYNLRDGPPPADRSPPR